MKIFFDQKKKSYNIFLSKKNSNSLKKLRIIFKGINWFKVTKFLVVSNINIKDQIKNLMQYKNILLALLRYKYIIFVKPVYKIPSRKVYLWTKYILKKNEI